MSDPSCERCHWAFPVVSEDGDDMWMQCRRFPRQIVLIDDEPTGVFPNADEWCGEFKESAR